jgi:hypothetical protein
VGGGVHQNGSVPAKTAAEAAQFPFFGIWGSYNPANGKLYGCSDCRSGTPIICLQPVTANFALDGSAGLIVKSAMPEDHDACSTAVTHCSLLAYC